MNTITMSAGLSALAILTASLGAGPSLTAQLRAEDEKLLSAVHSGGRDEWERVTSPDFSYIEAGEREPRAQFLAELEPDDGVVLRIRDYEVARTGDLAIVTHRDEVPFPENGRPPGTYLFTETWLHGADGWKLHLINVDPVHSAPPSAHVPKAQLEALIGVYRRKDKLRTVEMDNDGLLVIPMGEKSFHLSPETPETFFDLSDLRSRVIFNRDPATGVLRMIRRDENNDTVWAREP